LTFYVFENKCHATDLTPKPFFIFCIFEKECRVTRAIN